MTPLRKAFHKQKWHAKVRGISFRLTFDQWLEIWVSSGHLAERGRKKDQYVMARTGDVGPYAIGNVQVVTAAQNKQEQLPPWIGRRHTPETRRKISDGKVGNTNGCGNRGRVFKPETIERRRQTMIAKGMWR